MPKTTLAWNPADYATVAERIAAFYSAFPRGRILTELASWTGGRVTFKASVYRTRKEAGPAATGWASEREGDGDVNQAACLENAETSAVGRALANLGFSASRRVATPGAPDPVRRDAPRVRPVRERPVLDAAPRDAEPTEERRRAEFDARQRHADAVHDALVAVDMAERAGMPEVDVARHRHALASRSVAPSAIARVERELREWMRARFPEELPPLPGDDPDDDAGDDLGDPPL